LGIEIERKFLVKSSEWRGQTEAVTYAQGYLATDPERTVRVRIAGSQGFLTIKGATVGCSRPEFEYAIPVADAEAMLSLCCTPPIHKLRYTFTETTTTDTATDSSCVWQVDEFLGPNQGLIMAEVELTHPDQVIQLPAWVGVEVTGDPRYYNSSLARYPYQLW
jgi:adenylate cyclase